MKKLIFIVVGFAQLAISQNNEWKIFNTLNSPLPSNNILCLDVDIFNNIWIGTASGLIKKSNDDWVIYNQINSDIPVDLVSYIQSDKDGIVWLTGSDNGYPKGLIKFDGADWTIFDTLNSPVPSVVIESIAIDSLNNKWLLAIYNPATTYLTKFDGDSVWNTFPGYYNFVVGNGDQVTSDPFNNVWTAARYYIAKFDGQNYTFFNSSQPMGNYITAVRNDLFNNIWIAGGLAGWGGLTKFDGTNFTYYFDIPAITLANDQANNIWIGSQSDPFISPGELVKFDGTTWTYFTTQNSPLPDNDYIKSIRFDKFGNLWLGLYIDFEDSTRGGLVQFHEGGIITSLNQVLKSQQYYLLSQNYPNPFNPSTIIKYTVPSVETRHTSSLQMVTLKVYDVLGNEVATLVNEEKPAGEYEVEFNAKELPSGIYFYQLKAGLFNETKKMVLLK